MESILEIPAISLTASDIDAMITMRLIAFHQALVERRQLPPAPPAEDPVQL